ncbi:hypothetical protein CCACVL1_24935 [Corchorus capsularis]|uniref:Uncharacterized protein n=1 Tax=Corchorus capsularis TaxID=210143 RepID=A0A1R3GMK7_COCAP|nr:hypothetical protein CCACVL1_24935 [Corchorus capsularis]
MDRRPLYNRQEDAALGILEGKDSHRRRDYYNKQDFPWRQREKTLTGGMLFREIRY